MDKKALTTQGTLTGIIMTLVMVGILLGIGFLVLQEFEDSLGTTSTQVDNEQHVLAVDGFYVSANWTSQPCYNAFNIINITDVNTTLVNSDNYTFATTTGKVAAVAGAAYAEVTANVTYTYNAAPSGREGACDGIRETGEAINEIPQWLAIIVIMIIVGIILAIVFKVLPNAGGSESFGGTGSFGGSNRSESSGTVAEI